MYFPEDQSKENLSKIRRESVCAECGRQLSEYLDRKAHKVYIACSGQIHEGITREYKPPVEDYQSKIRREHEMVEEGVTTAKETNALVAQGIPMTGIITKDQATAILQTVWKDAPPLEVYKAAMLCQDFGLHPLMKHVYLIPYNKGKPNATWATVLGIGATRLIMSRLGSFGYTDDTPRIMSEEEQVRIFGKVDNQNIVAITKLRTKDGLTANGYGKYPKTGGSMIGEDKGNSRENQAFIRSERNAFGRLFPDANMPKAEIEVVDEQYLPTPSGLVETATGVKEEGEQEPIEAKFREFYPESKEPEPEATEQSEKPVADPTDVELLISAANKLHWDILSYMRETYNLGGTGTIHHAWSLLNDEQKAKVKEEVEARLLEIK